jgi:hypothetical protein
MSIAKQKLIELIEDMPEGELGEVIDFVSYLKMKRNKDMYKDLQKASESSLDFWDSPTDDEVWNNV